MEKINCKINDLRSCTAQNKSSNNHAKINITPLESTPKTDTFSSKNKKKLVKIGVVISVVGAVLFAFKKHIFPPLKKAPVNNLVQSEKLQPGQKEEHSAQNAFNDILPSKPEQLTNKNKPEKLREVQSTEKQAPTIRTQKQKNPETIKNIQQEASLQDEKINNEKITQEQTTPEIKEEIPSQAKQKVQEELPEANFANFNFNEKILESLENIKKTIMSENPQAAISDELLNDCLKEQKAIEKAYDALDEIWNKTTDEKSQKAMLEEFKKLTARYNELNFAQTAKEIADFKTILDEYDLEAYGKITSHLKKKFGDESYKYLYKELKQEIGRRSFKTSPVYNELLTGAQKLGLEGSEEEKIIKLLKEAEKHELGSGAEGIVYHIPETTLAIKTFNGNMPEKLNDFQYLAEISEYDAVNNVLAKGGHCEIQKHIDGVKGFILNKDIQRIISNMPQEAYDDLLTQVVRINKAGRGIDTGGANVIIDAINQRFIPIDLHSSTHFEAGFRTTIDDLGRNKIDPLAHTIGNFSLALNSEDGSKLIGKILKSIARDTKNHEMFLFDTSFYEKRRGNNGFRRTIVENFKNSQLNEELGREIDEAFSKLHQLKLQLAKSNDAADKEKLNQAIDDFCALVDEKLLSNTPDLSPKELSEMQMKINAKYEKNKKISSLKDEISINKRFLKALNKKESLTDEQIQEKLEIEQELEELTKKLKKLQQ